MVTIRTVAVLFILLGVTAMAIPTLGVTTFDTDRETILPIGSQQDAMVGISDSGNVVELPTRGQPTVVGHLQNNMDESFSVTYSVVAHDNSLKPEPDWDSVQVEPGGTAEITARCRTPGEGGEFGSGSGTLTVYVDTAYTNGVAVEDLAFDITVEYDCVDPSQNDEEDSNADTSGNDSGNEQVSGESAVSIDSVALSSGQGNSIDVTVTLSADIGNTGTELHITSLESESKANPEFDSIIVAAENGTYSVDGADRAKGVEVELVAENGEILDTVEKVWN